MLRGIMGCGRRMPALAGAYYHTTMHTTRGRGGCRCARARWGASGAGAGTVRVRASPDPAPPAPPRPGGSGDGPTGRVRRRAGRPRFVPGSCNLFSDMIRSDIVSSKANTAAPHMRHAARGMFCHSTGESASLHAVALWSHSWPSCYLHGLAALIMVHARYQIS
jgi:hypothetical protein